MQSVKSPWKSKTVWLGILMVLAAIIEYVAGLPPETSALQAVSGILTVIVRFLTNQPISKPTK